MYAESQRISSDIGNVSLVIVGLVFGIYIEASASKHYDAYHEHEATQYLDVNVSITPVGIWTKRTSSGRTNNQMYEGWSKDCFSWIRI